MKRFCQPIQTHESSSKLSRCRQLLRPKRLGIALTGLLAFWVVLLSACQTAEIKPLEIVTGDTCARCKAPITEKHFAAEFVTKDRFVRKFDDISCLIQHAAKVGKNNIAAYYVADFPSQKWLKAEEAHFVQSDQISTPKNSGILAFKDEAQAKTLASQYQAKLVKFSDLIK
jgi:nitrous oxide reductase accessory protein NosL